MLDYLCEPHPGSVILMTICQLGRVGRIFVAELRAGLVRGVCRGKESQLTGSKSWQRPSQRLFISAKLPCTPSHTPPNNTPEPSD